jgi:hypothetical protein
VLCISKKFTTSLKKIATSQKSESVKSKSVKKIATSQTEFVHLSKSFFFSLEIQTWSSQNIDPFEVVVAHRNE